MLARIFGGDKPPIGLKYRASNWFIVSTVTLSVFTDVFLYGVIVPVIPFALRERAHVDEDRVQYWVSVLLAVYGAGLIVSSPICGFFSDRISARRWPLLLGLIALLGATIMLNVATSVPVYVIGRLLQGISAAVVWVVGLALLADTVPKEMLAQYIGYVSLGMTTGFMIGPLLGGVLFTKAGYNGVWALCYAFIGLDLVCRVVLIEKKDARRWATEEALSMPPQESTSASSGNVHRTASNEAEADAEAEAPDAEDITETLPQTKPTTKLRKLRSHLPPVITLLASRRLLAALFASIVQASLVASFDSILPIFVDEKFGWGSLQSGILYLTIVIPTLASPIVGYFSDKYGGRLFCFVGFLLSCPLFVLLRLVTHNSLSQKVLLIALLVLIGCAMTLLFPPIMAEITHVVIAKEESSPPGAMGKGGAYAQAYALFNVAFAVGTLVGPIWAGLIKQNYGWNTMAWTLGLLAGVTALPCLVWVDGSLRKSKRKVFSRRYQNESNV
ncbi:putative MFS amine transporter [Talaromyces proteolyticus]|uniref:MFS amine transporter n=1 Tax=Talaromyces proteolyticus TaxID=1131652 RepID=A0AAD4Q5B2_9EURO|nr:putative MFS amine transporter [Talaromyces proteolyticus]KAH8703850.1 putative MFS amine transporter [Talaromyces proteolyticus]